MTTLVRLLVSLALLGWLAWRTDWQQVAAVLAHLRVELWLGALVLYLISQLVSALRWQLLARPLGLARPLHQHVAFYFIGMYFNLFLPTSVGGDVIRAWYLDGGQGQRLPAFLSVFVDRLSGLMVLLGLACLGSLLTPVPMPPWIRLSVWLTAGAAVVGLLVARPLSRPFRRFERVARLIEGAKLYVRRVDVLVFTTLLSLIVQALNILLVWLIGMAINAPIPASYYWIFVPMVTLLTVLPISLNGMGVREGGTVLFLLPLAVDRDVSLTLAVLWFAVYTVASVLGCGVYLLGHFPRPAGSLDNGSVGSDSDQGRTGQSASPAPAFAASAGSNECKL